MCLYVELDFVFLFISRYKLFCILSENSYIGCLLWNYEISTSLTYLNQIWIELSEFLIKSHGGINDYYIMDLKASFIDKYHDQIYYKMDLWYIRSKMVKIHDKIVWSRTLVGYERNTIICHIHVWPLVSIVRSCIVSCVE